MTYTSNVPQITYDSNGMPIIPQESAVLAGVQSDINVAFGGGVNPQLSSPQGQLAQSLTAIIGEKNNEIAYISNQFNPETADGQWQDALAKIYFLDRIASAGTVVTGLCTGLVGTVIPAGATVQDANGYIYYATAAGTIGTSGNVSIQFQNSTTGAITCAIGALNKIYTSIFGWESVTNLSAGALGNDVESRADFEYRRKNSVALNAVNSTQSVYASVLSVNNVIDAYVVDNPSGVAINYGATNYSLKPHSIVVSVAGGASSDIALAIWNKKSQGCDYNGNTSYSVTDNVNYSAPYPTYVVTWLTPTATPTYFAVQIANNSNLPSDIVTQTQNAIIAAFNGTDGGTKARIGSSIYSGRYYNGINAINSNVSILSILMGTSSGDVTHASLAFGIDQLPTLSAANISVTLV